MSGPAVPLSSCFPEMVSKGRKEMHLKRKPAHAGVIVAFASGLVVPGAQGSVLSRAQ